MNFAVFIEDQADKLEQAFNKSQQTIMSKMMKKMGGKQDNHGILMVDDDGNISGGYRGNQETLRDFAAKLFEGLLMTFEEHVEMAREDRMQYAYDTPLPEIDPKLVPDIHSIAVTLAHKALRKAFGEDLINGEALRVFANEFASH